MLSARDFKWADASVADSKPGSRLLATITILGVPHHAEALEVQTVPDEEAGEPGFYIQETTDPYWQETFDTYFDATGAGDPFQTVNIKGRSYAIFISPHCG